MKHARKGGLTVSWWECEPSYISSDTCLSLSQAYYPVGLANLSCVLAQDTHVCSVAPHNEATLQRMMSSALPPDHFSGQFTSLPASSLTAEVESLAPSCLWSWTLNFDLSLWLYPLPFSYFLWFCVLWVFRMHSVQFCTVPCCCMKSFTTCVELQVATSSKNTNIPSQKSSLVPISPDRYWTH